MDTQNPNQSDPINSTQQVDYGSTVPASPESPQQTPLQEDASIYSNMAQEITMKTWTGISSSQQLQSPQTPQQIPQSPPPVQSIQSATTDDGIKTFATQTIVVPSIDIFTYIKKFFVILVPSIPVILILIAFILFLIEKNFDITQVSEFPGWTTTQLESFVKQNIIPAIPSSNL